MLGEVRVLRLLDTNLRDPPLWVFLTASPSTLLWAKISLDKYSIVQTTYLSKKYFLDFVNVLLDHWIEPPWLIRLVSLTNLAKLATNVVKLSSNLIFVFIWFILSTKSWLLITNITIFSFLIKVLQKEIRLYPINSRPTSTWNMWEVSHPPLKTL